MRKEAILLGGLLSTSMLGSAATVNMPGADPSIPETAYKTYIYSNADMDKEYLDGKAVYTKKLRQSPDKYLPPNEEFLNDEETNKRVNQLAEDIISTFRMPTDINIHNSSSGDNGTNGIRFTLPLTTEWAEFRYSPKEKLKDYIWGQGLVVYSLEIESQPYNQSFDYFENIENLSNNDIKSNFVKNDRLDDKKEMRYKKNTIKGSSYTYPTMINTYWDSAIAHDSVNKEDVYVSTINFNLPSESMPRYHLGYMIPISNRQLIKDNENILANYIVPSIQDTRDLDNYSTVFKDVNYSYRVFKDKMYFKPLPTGLKGYYSRNPSGITQSLEFSPLPEVDTADLYGIVYTGLGYKWLKYDDSNMIKSESYRMVWNDEYPGIFIDLQLTDGREIMVYSIQTDTEVITHQLHIPASYSGLSNEQLRHFVTDIEIFNHHTDVNTPKELDLFGLLTDEADGPSADSK